MEIYVIIFSLVILLLLIILTSLIIKKLVIDINSEALKKYLLNVSRYEEVDKNIEEESNNKINNPFVMSSPKDNDNNQIIISDIAYKGEGVLKKAKEIDRKFNLDDEAIIKYFLEYYLTGENDLLYDELVKTKNTLDKLNPKDKVKSVEKEKTLKKFPKEIAHILEIKFSLKKSINVLEVIDTLEEEIKKYDSRIYIYVGNKNRNYSYLNNKIVTKYDEAIYKGVKIYYHNQMYDYSIE